MTRRASSPRRFARKPYSVVLFDEIEKAHPDVLNILLQILDDGHITDAHGRKVNFENTVIVMTSNAGSNSKVGSVGFDRTAEEQGKERAMKALQDFLRPEFHQPRGRDRLLPPAHRGQLQGYCGAYASGIEGLPG